MKLKKMYKAEQEASAADDSREAKAPVKQGTADTDNEGINSGVEGELKEVDKSEDSAPDSDHISHPRQDGEEEQQGGMGKAEDEGSEEDEEEDEAEETEKSLTPRDLEKSMALLESFVSRNKPSTRKDALLKKAQTSTLSKSEQAELFDILGGKAAKAPSLAKSVTRGLDSNSEIQKALDVSGYLTELTNEVKKSLNQVASFVEESARRQQEFNILLARTVTGEGTLLKSLVERTGALDARPAYAPKSQVARNAVLRKGFGGGSPAEESLTKSDVLDAFDAIHNEVLAKSGSAVLDGEDISIAISKYESFNQISPKMLNAVRNHTRTRVA